MTDYTPGPEFEETQTRLARLQHAGGMAGLGFKILSYSNEKGTFTFSAEPQKLKLAHDGEAA